MSDISVHGGDAAIHDRVGATNPPHDGDAVQLKPGGNGCAAAEPLAAVQVVDRLRWWRTHRVREQPMPVDHVVLRGSYTNYSPFGARPLAPAVARLLQRAKVVQAQYQRAMQLRDGSSQRRQTSSLFSISSNAEASLRLVCVERPDTEARPSPPLQESAPDEEAEEQRRKDLLDNKRTAGSATADIAPSSPPPPPPPLGPPRFLNVADVVCLAGAEAALTEGAAVSLREASSSDVAPSPATLVHIPTEAEAKAAERLLMLYRRRSASAPPRPRHHRIASGQSDASSVQRARHGEADGAVELHHGSVTQVSTSDEIMDVCHAPGAAAAVVVLHHAPRVILYEKGLNPKVALRAARVSSDALESLSDAAAESSAEVFAMTNLPLCGYERFFYQQQMRGPADAAAAGHRQRVAATSSFSLRSSPAPADVEAATEGDVVSLDSAVAATTPAATPELASSPAEHGLKRAEESFFFGAPLTAVPACSPIVRVPPSPASGAAPAAGVRLSRYHSHHAGRGRGRATLRAVSQPALPRVYKSGCPQMTSTRTRHHSRGRPTTQASPSATASSSSVLPAALLARTVPQDGAHLCQRVDDLQDVYAFNPVVDVLGKGAFSKVYAAVPILRGRDGLQRFSAPMAATGVAAVGGGAAPDSASGRPPSCPTPPPAPHVPHRSASSDAAAPRSCHDGTIAGNTSDKAATRRQRSASPATVSLPHVPVVALKVIPRKARQQPNAKAAPVPRPSGQARAGAAPGTTSPAAGTAGPSSRGAPAEDNSVRRELVEIEREVSILRRLRHTGCAQFYEALRTPDAFVIAMRVLPGSMDARRYLSRYGAPSEARTALMVFQLVSTVHYLHTTFGLIHRDIKLENVLLSEADADVPDTCIREVLGGAVHKSQAATRTGTAAQRGSSTLCDHVQRLLRVTLIDFGLARRTRVSAASGAGGGSAVASASSSTTTAAARMRRAAGRNASLSASMTSPSHLTALAATTASGSAMLSPHHPPPPLPPTPTPHNTNTGSGSVSPRTHTSFNWAAAAAALSAGGGAVVPNNGSGSGMSNAPAARPPLMMRRSPSTAGGGGAAGGVGLGARLGAGVPRSVSRVGMPSPMPSTANMFTRYLDLEEMEEDDANGGTGGGGGHDGADASTTTTACMAAPPGEGSHGEFAAGDVDYDDADSGASSTDVSASETGSDSESVSSDSAGETDATAPCEAAEAEEVAAGSGETSSPPPPPPVKASRRDGCATCLSPSVLTATPTPPPLPQLSHAVPMSAPGRTAATPPDCLGGSYPSLSAGCGVPLTGMRPRCTSHAQFPHHSTPAVSAAQDDTEATLLLTPCGTEKYLPPEVLSWVLEHGWVRRSTTVGLARAMDLYAIGIIAYVLLSGCFPFNASSRATLLQQQQRVPRCNSARWSGVSSAAIAFVQRLLEPNPEKRMSAKEALEHPFLQEARQLAEKLSLVPHGEGEEVTPSHASGRDGSQADYHGDGSTATTAVYPRPHWAVDNTASTTLSRAAPSPTQVDRARMGAAAAATAAGERPSGNPNAFATLVPQVMGSAPVHGGGSLVFLHQVDSGHGPRRFSDAPPRSNSGGGGGSGHGHGTNGEEHDDVLSSLTRDMLGDLSLPRRQPAMSPAPTALAATPLAAPVSAGTLSSWPTVSAAATHFSAAAPLLQPPQEQPVLAKPFAVLRCDTAAPAANLPTAPRPPSAPAREERSVGGADDLFASLYNNIMSSD